jgi:hypothetical protein
MGLSDYNFDNIFDNSGGDETVFDVDPWMGPEATYDFTDIDLGSIFGDIDLALPDANTTTDDTGGWGSDITDFVKNNQSLLGGLVGLAKGGIESYYTGKELDSKDAYYTANTELNKAILADKVITRAKHNDSINKGPQEAPKTIKRLS